MGGPYWVLFWGVKQPDIEMVGTLLLSISVLILVIYGLRRWVLRVTIIVVALVGFTNILLEGTFTGMGDYGLLLTSCWVDVSRGLLIMAGLSLLLVYSSKNIDREEGDSWVLLMLMVLLGSLLLVSSGNWVWIYLTLELQTLILFILVAKTSSVYGTEAGLKYLVLGAISSGLFLFGCALLYGGSGDTSVQGINSVLMGPVGKIFITISLLFKLSSAPFHMWAPDVYEGAPTITTALLVSFYLYWRLNLEKGHIAQLVGQWAFNPEVIGSSPIVLKCHI